MFATEPNAQREAPGLLDAVRRFLAPIVAITVSFALAGMLIGVLSASKATAEGHITLTDPRGDTVLGTGSSVQIDLARYSEDRADFAQSTAVLTRAAEIAGSGSNAEDLRDACDASGSVDSNVLTISCSYTAEKRAAASVDAIAQAYSELSLEATTARKESALTALEDERTRVTNSIDETKKAAADQSDEVAAALAQSLGNRLTNIDERVVALETTTALYGDGVSFYDSARILDSSSKLVLIVRNGIIAGAIGALIGIAIAWFRADRMPVVSRGEDVSGVLGLPLLGELDAPRSGLHPPLELFSAPPQPYQIVASNLDALMDQGMVVFTSAVPVERHEDVVINIALVATHAGKRVLLIDADGNRRRVSRALGTSQSAGLNDVLSGAADPDRVTARISLGSSPGLEEAELFLLGPGAETADSVSLYRSRRAEAILDHLRRSYDLVIIDGPPLLASAETAGISRSSDGIVLLVRNGTPLVDMENAHHQLSFMPADGIGFVMLNEKT